MRSEVSLLCRAPAQAGVASTPRADNDDDPFDPPPARAMRAPAQPQPALIVACGAREIPMQRAA